MMQEVLPKTNTQKQNESEIPREATINSSLRELHEQFIKYKLHGARNAQATIKNYHYNFGLLMQFKPDIKLDDLTEKNMINFFEFLNIRERKVGKQQVVRTYKNSSMAVLRSKLAGFFNWLVERQYITVNPFDKIPYPKVSYTDKRAFSPKEFHTICHAVNTKIQWASLFVKKRNIAIVMLLVLTGVRKEELIGLQLSDIDIERGLITVRAETSKSKRTRIIPMNSELVSYLEDYLNYRRNFNTTSFWVSGTMDRGFTEHGAKHFVDLLTKVTKINCHLHRYRHTFAINYYNQTHDIVGLHILMGHRSLKMTLSYLRSLPDEHVVKQLQKMTIAEFV